MKTLRTMTPFLSLLLLAGCAGAPIPAQRMASAEAAVRAAQEIGAENVPTASLYLKFAQDQIAQAQKIIKDGDYKEGEWVLARAEVDAELALALAREHSTRVEAQQAIERVQALRQK